MKRWIAEVYLPMKRQADTAASDTETLIEVNGIYYLPQTGDGFNCLTLHFDLYARDMAEAERITHATLSKMDADGLTDVAGWDADASDWILHEITEY